MSRSPPLYRPSQYMVVEIILPVARKYCSMDCCSRAAEQDTKGASSQYHDGAQPVLCNGRGLNLACSSCHGSSTPWPHQESYSILCSISQHCVSDITRYRVSTVQSPDCLEAMPKRCTARAAALLLPPPEFHDTSWPPLALQAASEAPKLPVVSLKL
jgi:hypothetical protein